jgi:hypothetical protein
MVMQALSVFEIEFNEFGENYTELLEKIKQATGGVFNPTDIEETISDSDSRVSFLHKGKEYKMQTEAGRIDDLQILSLVNKALAESGSNRLLCALNVGIDQDDWVRQIFVSKKVYAKALDLGLFPFDEGGSFYGDEN